jgi:hypothetical protein
MLLDIEKVVADLVARAREARRYRDSARADALEECSREVREAAEAYEAAQETANSLLDRSGKVRRAMGRPVEGARQDAVVHARETVAPAFARLATALQRSAGLLKDSKGPPAKK